MSRITKELIEADLQKKYKDLDNALIVSVHGLTGVEVNTVRGALRKKQIEVHVVKNRAMKRVIKGTPLEPLGKVLTGPCAFVTGGGSPVDTAKHLLDLVKDYPKLELKHGVLDGETAALTIDEISKRRSKAELQGEVVMLFCSPARRIAGCLNVGGKVAGCIKAIVDKLEKGETIAKLAS